MWWDTVYVLGDETIVQGILLSIFSASCHVLLSFSETASSTRPGSEEFTHFHCYDQWMFQTLSGCQHYSVVYSRPSAEH
jgi:hypothetical protein